MILDVKSLYLSNKILDVKPMYLSNKIPDVKPIYLPQHDTGCKTYISPTT